jgi:single-stranded DNA-binding protein
VVAAVSLFILATGTLTADPRRRTSASAKEFAAAEDDPVLVSLIAFDLDACASLLNLRKGDSCSITGRAKLTRWTTKDGEPRDGLIVVAERVMSAYDGSKRRKSVAERTAG